ncbi:MAG: hypothetical protein AB7U20_02590 [Planctomycetaceae bacterium]
MQRPSLHRTSRRLLLISICLCGATAAAAGRLQRISAWIDLPGVDHYGNLDLANTFPVPFKIVINTKTGKVHALGRGKVQNLSRRLQTYRNQATMNPGLIDFPDLTLKRDLYVVAKNGNCRAIAVATVN